MIKDTEGDHSDPKNCRGLTLGVVFSFLFEHAMLMKIGHLLSTDSVQFGYKKRHSTSHAIFALKECVDYFTNRGSNIFAAFLDCSKGFDKVNHSGFFMKLIKRGIPLCFLNLLIYWYSNLSSLVKWNGVLSETFRVYSGVRQGGVFSPRLFSHVHATLQPALSVRPSVRLSVRPSVRRSVRPSHFTFLYYNVNS